MHKSTSFLKNGFKLMGDIVFCDVSTKINMNGISWIFVGQERFGNMTRVKLTHLVAMCSILFSV